MALPPHLSRCPRITMPLSARGIPGGPTLGRFNYLNARPGLENHAHPSIIEICFLEKGRQTYQVGDEICHLSGGDLFITYPGESHSTGGHPEGKGILYWLMLPLPAAPPCDGEFLGLPTAHALPLLEALAQRGPRHFRGRWEMKDLLDSITELYHAPTPDPLHPFVIANRLGDFLWRVITAARQASTRRPSPSLAAIQHYINQHLEEPLPIPHLAAQAGLSTSRFKAWFKQEAGVPPGEFIARTRIQEAERRLASGQRTITEIAFEFGFSSSQYFATTYKRFTGRTPSGRRQGANGDNRVLTNGPLCPIDNGSKKKYTVGKTHRIPRSTNTQQQTTPTPQRHNEHRRAPICREEDIAANQCRNVADLARDHDRRHLEGLEDDGRRDSRPRPQF